MTVLACFCDYFTIFRHQGCHVCWLHKDGCPHPIVKHSRRSADNYLLSKWTLMAGCPLLTVFFSDVRSVFSTDLHAYKSFRQHQNGTRFKTTIDCFLCYNYNILFAVVYQHVRGKRLLKANEPREGIVKASSFRFQLFWPL